MRPLPLPGARPLPTVAESTQALNDMAAAAKAAASRRNGALATATRWRDGPGPLTHGASSHMTRRCRDLNGRACQTCRDAEATRARARRAAQREDTP